MSVIIDTTMVQKHLHAAVKRIDERNREIEFIASHERPDADGELVVVAGINLSRYKQNPVVFLQHDRFQPVARTLSLVHQTLDGAPALIGRAVFPEGDEDSERVYRQVKDGLLGAVSIGFLPLEQGPPRLPGQKGVTHIRTELLEISLVTLPSCPTCIITAKAAKVPPTTSEDKYLVDFTMVDKLLQEAIRTALVSTVKESMERVILLRRGRVD